MSNLLSGDNVEFQTVTVGSLAHAPAASGFRARFVGAVDAGGYRPATREETARADPVEQARADGFAQGFDEGVRVASESLSADADARERLVHALEQLAPASNGELSSLLSAAVMRLVSQIVGNVPVDADLLRQRCESVAAFIDESQARNSLAIHPDDAPLIEGFTLGVPLVHDASLSRGCIRLDTADGWIEDGPDMQLSRLRAMLDDMEGRP
ncbi:flagellar biosynthesis protein [Sphingobium subterraneum]|uniref:Flagellar assembly protein FliH n=1 Tax=Sphingobium subterraneum TaxID=627688 RepID=A0A841IZM6_9SPHN|nr:flagellar biosynthesis protein [Sphingobium subterraneum]MBB6123780.1 flagellar assembly protein FliH [Sphingobium subterraneum]